MSRQTRYKRRRGRRVVPVLAIAVVALVVGAVVGSDHGPPYTRNLATEFTKSWATRDYSAMYDDIDGAARRATSESAFAAVYREALTTATATTVRVSGKARELADGAITVPVVVVTRLFGTLRMRFTLRFRGTGEAARIAWSRSLEFPGLTAGELLTRRMALPPRASLLDREGGVLASGPAEAAGERYSPLGAAASSVVGEVGPIPSGERATLEGEGVPSGAIVGVNGLERIFDAQLRGKPGGKLLAGSRVIATAKAQPGRSVRTTISASLQEATVRALGEHYGGVVVQQPSTGQILAVAGIGLDGLQPPGSTFKMVTVTGVLQSGIAKPATTFPYKSEAVLDGVKLKNSEAESCGGTLILSFAVSCNSVFAPLGVKLGAKRLVAVAERYGFNHAPGIPGAAESTIPAARDIQGELDVGSTSIGQGEVLASPLEMATVAATIADGGLRHEPTDALGRPTRTVRVSSPAIAAEVRTMMIHVVTEGTGDPNAQIPGVVVAGKTGTAELGNANASGCSSESSSGSSSSSGSGCSAQVEKEDTDGWFAAFAPAEDPKLAVGVLMVRDGFGADSAAPVAKEILEAGLGLG